MVWRPNRAVCRNISYSKKIQSGIFIIFGAIVGCLIGGADLSKTISIIITGTQSVMGTVIRVLAAGVLAGVMMQSGAAGTIAQAIVKKWVRKKRFLRLP